MRGSIRQRTKGSWEITIDIGRDPATGKRCGRAKTCFKKFFKELKELQEAGLSRIHVGFESGCDEILKFVDKGVTAEEEITGGRKVVDAGISLSEYVMPGLGGKRWSEKHILDSAGALNQINPDFIRLRSLALRRDSPLFEKYEAGEFEPLTEGEMVNEIGLLIENLTCSSYLASDHVWNLLMEIEGQLPQDKEKMLGMVREYQAKPPVEKLKFNLRERLKYWSIPDDPQVKKVIQEAWRWGAPIFSTTYNERLPAFSASRLTSVARFFS